VKAFEAFVKAAKLNSRVPALEEIIKTDPEIALKYTLWVIRDRWPEGEDIILTCAKSSYLYAKNIIKNRWIDAENTIMKDAEASCLYSMNLLKSKLPDPMHNMMLLRAIENPNNSYAKLYFDYLEQK
jgi:hypothetical protein